MTTEKISTETKEQYGSRLGHLLAQELQGVTEEAQIKKITLKYWEPIVKAYPDENPIKMPRKVFRKALNDAFPPVTEQKPGYYKTSAGKGQVERFDHISLWYVTTNKTLWEISDDTARNKYWKSLPALSQLEAPPESQLEAPPEMQTKLELEKITIDQLKLDMETQEVVEEVLISSGINLSDFIKKACDVYAKTLKGKFQKGKEDLSNVPTPKLRNSEIFRTHPGRAEELIKRAIQAIKIHNGQSTEVSQKWLITQSLLLKMTGSKPSTIQEMIGLKDKDGNVLKVGKFQNDVESFNKKLKEEYQVNDYLNRKSKEVAEKFVAEWIRLIPDGLDA